MNSPSAPLPDLVKRWQHGWGMCRNIRRAKQTPEALHATLKLPGRYHEIIALHADDRPSSVAELIAQTRAAAQPTWLTIPSNNVEAVTDACVTAGLELIGDPESLMTIDLRQHPHREAPQHYNVGTAVLGRNTIQALAATPDSLVAASGVIAVSSEDAVAHGVRTNEDHRRRGLGDAIMTALAQEAVEAGAKTGLLVASAQGRKLYESLGWKVKASVVSARVPLTMQVVEPGGYVGCL